MLTCENARQRRAEPPELCAEFAALRTPGRTGRGVREMLAQEG